MSESFNEPEARIRDRAFHLWEEAGCPEDRAMEFWERAKAAEAAPVPPDEDVGNFA